MRSVLERIALYKRDEIEAARRSLPLAELQSMAAAAPPPKGFNAALVSASRHGFGLIAEVKKASPSKGVICERFDPSAISHAYCRGGAACLSVLTDGPSFQGSLDHLGAVAASVPLPCLRKDFMLDPYQVWQARAAGADCILIIMAMVSDYQAAELEGAALECGMDCLIEVHCLGELERAANLRSRLIGVNNRDLKTFSVSVETTFRLLPHMPPGATLVAESGLSARSDLERLASSGVRCFLIGESLMRSADPESAVRSLLAPPHPQSPEL